MQDRLKLLTASRDRAAPERQQTLRAALEWESRPADAARTQGVSTPGRHRGQRVRSQAPHCNWDMRYREHRWQHPSSNQDGFIDLVLTQLQRVCELVIECKRVRETEWVFLQRAQADLTTLARGLASCNRPRRQVLGWHDTQAILSSPGSEFCLVIGEDSTRGTMLERLSAVAVESTEALAAEDEQFTFASVPRSPMRIYFPVIVTTAALKMCKYDNSALDLPTGTLKEAKFEDAGFVRFRKQVGAAPTAGVRGSLVEPSAAAEAKESTVFVVNVNHLKRFLDYSRLADQELINLMQAGGDGGTG